MIRYYIVVILFIPFFSYANSFCDRLNRDVEREQYYINSDESGYKVKTRGRTYFYSAPSEVCKLNHVFIIRSNHVDVQAEYNGYSSVIFFKKDGNPIQGWVKTDSLIPTGTGIGPKP